MNIKELMAVLNAVAPFKDAEDWDNVGLLVGSNDNTVTGVMTTLDCNLDVIDEALNENVNTIIAHHPIIFPKISKLDDSYQSKIIKTLIKNDMNLIVMHTNLDHQDDGVSVMIAETLGLKVISPLIRHDEVSYKLRVNIPKEDKETFKKELSDIGFGNQGDYSECFFEYDVQGQFRPNEHANPTIGTHNELEYVDEVIIEAIFDGSTDKILKMIEAHPYEEPAYDVFTITKPTSNGLGVVAEFNGTMDALVKQIKTSSKTPIVNVVKGNDEKLARVAIVGGSGASFISQAMRQADCLITGDIKYHEAFDAKEEGFNLIDAGHYLEYMMIDGLKNKLAEKIDLKVVATNINTNPFIY
ncbi:MULTISPECIES: Nif3-like dinuclear metal center hexameric protein [unclassified Nosocomiicoccus]|uniref:Nif3-like dinuclear metal center hexameric protein n=1 Tax=unclassified Nosocomiicoccus TaxID=2646683 RepID=UPI0008A2F0A8|nr:MULTISPECIES: Nif3-like dinuclear metal center hexameric protein [unclassified Nosocomiicoccus]OFL47088.1 Nif3-like dinuclear metal center hexameric protein [Nosocomiicoccus sp. HMSC067E10]OFS64164.1 Nif3-like dinuclear metal center hexameric protein [Nosocomiicoccus sp. HMSC09A07]